MFNNNNTAQYKYLSNLLHFTKLCKKNNRWEAFYIKEQVFQSSPVYKTWLTWQAAVNISHLNNLRGVSVTASNSDWAAGVMCYYK